MRVPTLAPPLACAALLGAASPAAAGNLRLTIVSARLDARKLDRTHQHPRSNAGLSDLACLSLPGLRDTAGLCGISLGPDGVTPLPSPAAPAGAAPVDPMVRVEIGDKVVRTYPIPGTLAPRWDYGVVLDRRILDSDDYAKFILYDVDGPGAERKLGDKFVKARDLMKPGTKTLRGLGGAELTYKVEEIPDGAAARTYAFSVPSNEQMADLARRARTAGATGVRDGEYVVIPVSEGEVVEVFAAGKVYPSAKKHRDRVAGPNGIPTIQTKIQFNQPGFRGCPGCDHAALIGQIGSTGLVIGEHKKFTVENAGLLLLAINDLKTVDNEGSFAVKVSIGAPAASADRAPLKSRGGAGDSGPAGIDPRVVEQAIDAHGAEIEACVAAEPNPTGDIVLAFSISADGTPLGVIVEKASPNLKKAGECMRQKALKWKFPPPRGVVNARYPLSFSAG